MTDRGFSGACFFTFLILLFAADTLSGQVPLRMLFYFPQVADGRISGDSSGPGSEQDVFRTIVVLNNPNSTEISGTLTLFDSTGTALQIPFRCLEQGGTPCVTRGDIVNPDSSGQLAFTIPANGLIELMTARMDPALVEGYAKITAGVPGITGMAVFGQFEEKMEATEVEVEIEAQAAVEPTEEMQKFALTDFRKNEFEGEFGGLEFEFESESATGLAVVNVGAATTSITITEFDAAGVAVGTQGTKCEQFDAATKACSFQLGAGVHDAFFLSEAIVVPADFVSGTVVVESTSAISGTQVVNLTAVALKFDDEADDEGDRRNEFTIAPVTKLQ